MMSTFKKGLLLLVIAFTSMVIAGCVKEDFDAPPSGGVDPDISADQIVSLTDVMAKFVPTKYTKIGLDKYVKAVIVADDKSGNFYKTLILEDENSDLGIAVLIDENEIHAKYPVGTRVFLKLTDLYISDYNLLPQIGAGIDNSGTSPRLASIPSALLPTILIKGQYGIPVVPRVKKITELTNTDLNTLVKLEGVQFKTVTPTTTYADNNPISPLSINHNLVDCFNNQVIVRNSGFADFAGLILPSQNGSLTAVYSIFKTDKQFFIRDTSDIVFNKDRCGQVGSGTRISVKDLRALFTSGTTVAPAAFIQGVVISDSGNGNTDTRNMVLQDGDSGIVLRFSAAHGVVLGKEVKVNVGTVPMSEFNGLLQISTVPNENLTVLGDKAITPTIIKVSELNLAKHESTLITIKDVELSGGSTFGSNGGNITAKDATGTITLYTRSQASFASLTLPTGKISLTAVVSEFNTAQLIMRKKEDASGGGTVEPPTGIDETFSSQTNNVDISIAGWENYAVKGTRKWQGKLFRGNTYAQATAFNDTNPEMETWLISPEVETSKTGTLNFESATAFWVHDGMTVWATLNYTGNPATTTWVKINCKIAGKDDPSNEFIASGAINLVPLGAKIKIGFKYEGNGTVNTSTYRVDNVKVK